MKKNDANNLLKKIPKKNITIVYSGTLAIESALINLGIKKKDKVLVASSVCYSIIEAILRVNAIPIIVEPSNNFTLVYNDIKNVVEKEKPRYMILVHQFGIGQKIKYIKEKFPKIKIVEDIAQAWDIYIEGEDMMQYSDIVVTSFGKTKPLSLGYGGAIFSNNNLDDTFDYYDNNSRNNKKNMLPYYLKYQSQINYKKLIRRGNRIVLRQRKVAQALKFLSHYDFISIIEEGEDKYIWHRFPVLINNKYYDKFINYLEVCGVQYQLPHKLDVYEIPLLADKNFAVYKNKNKTCDKIILIRTRTNRLKNILKLKRKMKGMKI